VLPELVANQDEKKGSVAADGALFMLFSVAGGSMP
jgi:hypothetical protein